MTGITPTESIFILLGVLLNLLLVALALIGIIALVAPHAFVRARDMVVRRIHTWRLPRE